MADPRTQFLAHQDRLLGPWALHEADSGGRAFAEADHPYRTAYSRDRDRIVHCSAFRRLDYKTQVFVPHEQDHYRTRLTHTLEVAQVARTLARALRANEDAAEAVALAHDLGHAPFGHAGEAALNELMADHGRFEHNRQSLRVVDYLEHPYPDFRGLNLTRAVRLCLAKHSTRYDHPVCEEFEAALSGPLEGQLVDLADEIAFTVADTADALAAEWICPEQLEPLELWRRALAAARAVMPQARPIHQRLQAGRNLMALLIDDAIAETSRRLEELAPTSALDVQQARDRYAGFNPAMAGAVRQLQDFLLETVYRHEQALARQQEARAIVAELFAAYLADPSLMPPRYQERIAREGPHRVACDYIAGMTDRFCRQEHARVTRESLGNQCP